MTLDATATLLDEFRDALAECRALYLSAGEHWERHRGPPAPGEPADLVALMDDLHRGLVIKIYVSIAEADRRWSPAERRLAELLLEHVWGQCVRGDDLRDAAREVFDQSSRLRWSSLLGPFARYAPLAESTPRLRTLVTRLANIVAKADGAIGAAEQARLVGIEAELDTVLTAVPLASGQRERESESAERLAIDRMKTAAAEVRPSPDKSAATAPKPVGKTPRELLDEALAELDRLVGLAPIKEEIRTLVNYLKVQAERKKAGLPTGLGSLHMVFTGNPGTGKTTVARLVGRLLGAMGILSRGHLVETDRSGLVAQYAGQTAPLVNKRIDEALDGVLFIDEAYSLLSEEGEDPYGREAVQILLKRMEDDRHRLVVVLAGYPGPMDRLLKSNPGLSSRFNRQLAFPDYSGVQLGQLFGMMCDESHYTLTPAGRARLSLGFRWLVEHRDEHFGNGRLVRNVFEAATRRLANRIVGIAPLTHELLTQFEVDDLELSGVPTEALTARQDEETRFVVACEGCGQTSRIRPEHLGRKVKCRKCHRQFRAEWGEPDWTIDAE